MTTSTSFMHLDDRSVLDMAKQLALEERRATAALLRALMEIDRRQLYLGQGCASMFVYCTRVVAPLGRRGLQPHRSRAGRAKLSGGPSSLAQDRYLLRVTVSRETHDKLRRAQALLRHAVPSGDEAQILDRALTLLVEDLERRRFADTSRPRPMPEGGSRSRHIPATVRRAVWKRDAGQCAFTGSEGRCSETNVLEFHHVDPYAVGGPSTVDNIELRCRAHNAYEARLFFGGAIVREARAGCA